MPDDILTTGAFAGMLAALRRELSALGLSLDQVFWVWTAVQLAIIAATVAASWYAGQKLTPPIEARLRKIEGRPRLLRFLAVLMRRIPSITFVLLSSLELVIMRALTWPSRSYLLAVIASLATAWVVISVSARVIRNRPLARTVAIAAWVFAALNILGILPQTLSILDSIALELNNVRISLLTVVKGLVVLSFLVWLAVALSRLAENRIQASEELTPSVRVLLGKLIKAGLLILAILIGLTAIGIDFTALALFSGAVGLGLGFGLQKIVSNLVSGFILLMDKSIKPGDVISVGETFGQINSLSARYVSVIARDGREYLIPNEDLITQQVLNWSFTNRLVRLDIEFGVSYDSDPHDVRRLAREVAAAHDRVVQSRKPVCHLTSYGDSSINFVLRFWITDPHNGITNVRGDILLALWDSFKENGVSFAYPHREIIMRTPVTVETLAQTPPAQAKPAS